MRFTSNSYVRRIVIHFVLAAGRRFVRSVRRV